MKKKIVFILTYACVAFFGGVGLMLLIFADKSPRASEKENRMLAGFPELTLASLADGSFMTGLESYLSDGMFDRDGIVDATGQISALFSVNDESTDLEEQVAALAEAEGENEETSAIDDRAGDNNPSSSETEQTAGTEQKDTQSGEPEGSASNSETDKTGTDRESVQVGSETEASSADSDEGDWETCYFWLTNKDGSRDKLYTFSIENLQNAADVLNAYRATLPEDGKLYFAQIPFVGTGLSMMRGDVVDWECTVEEMLQKHTDDGVVIVSAPEVLKQHLLDGEYLYFHTDHHWTPRAANYLVRAFLKTQGITSYAYEDYRFKTFHDFYGAGSRGVPDDIDVLIPSLPTQSYVIDGSGQKKEHRYMVYYGSYVAYLGGTQGPWRQFVTGVHTGRNCLVIGDSYSNCFIPFLTPYYDNVFSTDFRGDYFTKDKAGCTLTEFVERYGISDIYLIPSTASSINSAYMLNLLWLYL